MIEIPFKAKTEIRYKLDGEWWTIPYIDKVVTFENLDTGGYMYGVVLSSVENNEWRVIDEKRLNHLVPSCVKVEPEFVEIAIQYKRKYTEAPLPCEELLDRVLSAIDYYSGDQIECSRVIVDGEMVTYFINVSKGHAPIKDILSRIAEELPKLNMSVRYTRTPEGVENII